MKPLTTFTDEKGSHQGPSIPLGDGNPFLVLQSGGTVSPGSHKGLEPQQMSESPFLGFLSNQPLPGMLQAPHHPFNSDYPSLTISSQQTGAPNIFTQWVTTPLGSPAEWKWTPLPGFVEIARSLRGDNTPCITINLISELTTLPGLLAGTAMATIISMLLQQDTTFSFTYIDLMMASMSLVSLGPTLMVGDCPGPTLEVVSELEDWRQLPPPPSYLIGTDATLTHHLRLSILVWNCRIVNML